MNDYNRPKLYLPLALLAAKPAYVPAIPPPQVTPHALRHLVAAMID